MPIKYTLLLLASLLALTCESKITTVIISFNTIYRPDQAMIAQYIRSKLRFRNYISLLFKGAPSSDTIKRELFEFLHTVSALPEVPTPLSQDPTYFPSEMEGTLFPPIFRQMFVSQERAHEQEIIAHISEHLKHSKVITSRTRRIILQAVIETIFQTELMNQFIQPNRHIVALLERLKKQDYQLVLIGNVPGFAWKEFLANYPQSAAIKKLFAPDHRFISGERTLLSTSPEMYKLMIDTLKLDPTACLVIESTLANTRYAQSCDIPCITFNEKKDSFKNFEKTVNKTLKN